MKRKKKTYNFAACFAAQNKRGIKTPPPMH